MPLTALDPVTALIVIDLQKGIAAYPTVHPMSDIIAKAAELSAAFRSRNLPVVFVNVTGGAPGRAEESRMLKDLPPDWSELVPELKAQPGDHRVTKRTWGAFTNTDLLDYLRSRSVTQIALCGVATSIGVESTARYAYEYDFNVTLVLDAMTDMRADAHENSVTRIFPRLGETCTASELLTYLQ